MLTRVLLTCAAIICVLATLEAVNAHNQSDSIGTLFANEQRGCQALYDSETKLALAHQAFRTLIQNAIRGAEARLGTPKQLPTDRHSITVNTGLLQQILVPTPVDCSAVLRAP